jgi:hypothetical protein
VLKLGLTSYQIERKLPNESQWRTRKKFIGLAVKNLAVPAQFEGVKESDNIASKIPNRAEFDESRFNDFKETIIATAWPGAFLKG